jgi:hypothetical protein
MATIHKKAILEKGNATVRIEIGSGLPYNDDEWYVCVWDNNRQPRAPMSQSEAYLEFYRRRDEYVAQGWREVAMTFHDLCER